MALRMAHLIRPLELQPHKIHPETGLTSFRSFMAKTKQKISTIRSQIPSSKALKERYPCKNKGSRMAQHIDKVQGNFPPNVVRLDAFHQHEEDVKPIPNIAVLSAQAVDLASAQAFQHHNSTPTPQANTREELLILIQPSRRSRRSRYCSHYAMPQPASSQDPAHPGFIQRIGNAREVRAIKRQRRAQQKQEIRGCAYGSLSLGSSQASLGDEHEDLELGFVCVGNTVCETMDLKSFVAYVDLMLMFHTEDSSEDGEGEVDFGGESEVSGPTGF